MVRSFLLALVVCCASTAYANGPDYGYDLRSNLTLAHQSVAGPVADANAPGFVKYLRDMHGRWRMGVEHLGSPAAFAPGIQANLWFAPLPDHPKADRVLEVRLAPLGKGQKMDVFVDGKKVGHTVFSSTAWQTHRIALDDTLQPAAFDCISTKRRAQGMRTAAALRYVRSTGKGPRPFPKLNLNSKRLCRPIRIISSSRRRWGIDMVLVPPKGRN